jgi:hypothetical protein
MKPKLSAAVSANFPLSSTATRLWRKQMLNEIDLERAICDLIRLKIHCAPFNQRRRGPFLGTQFDTLSAPAAPVTAFSKDA